MINDDLEKLLTRYIQGEITFTVYRQQRSQMVREFVEAKKPDLTIPQNMEKLLSVRPVAPAAPRSFEVPTIAREEALSTEKRIQISIVAGLIGVAITVWLLSQNHTGNAKNQNNTVVTQTAVSNEPFIEAFLNESVWDEETLSNFLLNWQKLSREKQAEAKNSTAFKQMHNELKLKMNAISKLKNIGDKEAEQQEQLLIWFATQLSINAV